MTELTRDVGLERWRGAALEAFAAEWAKLLANIHDPNTDPEAVRSVSITVAVKPDAVPDAAAYCWISSSANLAPHRMSDLYDSRVRGLSPSESSPGR